MNKDFRVSVAFADHPKTKKLMRRCGDKACWCLLRLWGFVAVNKPTGDLSGMDVDDVEIAAGWDGEEGHFVKALLDLRMLEGEANAFLIHDWLDHNSYAANAPKRSAQASKGAAARWGDKEGNAQSCAEQCSEHPSSNAQSCAEQCPLPSPSPTPKNPPNPPLGGEEGGADGVEPRQRRKPKIDRPAHGDRPQSYAAFKACFALYPIKQAEEDAWTEWCRLEDNGTLAPQFEIRESIIRHRDEDAYWKKNKAPLFWKWLKGKRWNDEPVTEPSADAQEGPPPVRSYSDEQLAAMGIKGPTW